MAKLARDYYLFLTGWVSFVASDPKNPARLSKWICGDGAMRLKSTREEPNEGLLESLADGHG